MARRASKPDIIKDGSFYKFATRRDPTGDCGPYILLKSGTGRALALLLSHEGTMVDLETIARETQWKLPERGMIRLASEINTWSRYYQIDAGIDSSYGIYRR